MPPRLVLSPRPARICRDRVGPRTRALAARQCWADATLVSTPPETTATESYGAQAMVCEPQVHPVVSGETGKQPSAGRPRYAAG